MSLSPIPAAPSLSHGTMPFSYEDNVPQNCTAIEAYAKNFDVLRASIPEIPDIILAALDPAFLARGSSQTLSKG
jgi:hypothetical protein